MHRQPCHTVLSRCQPCKEIIANPVFVPPGGARVTHVVREAEVAQPRQAAALHAQALDQQALQPAHNVLAGGAGLVRHHSKRVCIVLRAAGLLQQHVGREEVRPCAPAVFGSTWSSTGAC